MDGINRRMIYSQTRSERMCCPLGGQCCMEHPHVNCAKPLPLRVSKRTFIFPAFLLGLVSLSTFLEFELGRLRTKDSSIREEPINDRP